MSPTSPTLISLYSRLTTAHRRIRQLEAREAELLAQIEDGTLTRLVPPAFIQRRGARMPARVRGVRRLR